jgi:isopenicillin-N epimerase
MYAQRGCGFLYAAPAERARVHPTVISHGYGKGLAAEFDWTGTRDFSDWLSIPDGIVFMKEFNASRVRSYNHRLITDAARRISAAWGTPLDGPAALHGSMMAIRLPERLQRRDPAQLMSEWLARHRVVVAVMAIGDQRWARISAQVYNTAEDCDRLLSVV